VKAALVVIGFFATPIISPASRRWSAAQCSVCHIIGHQKCRPTLSTESNGTRFEFQRHSHRMPFVAPCRHLPGLNRQSCMPVLRKRMHGSVGLALFHHTSQEGMKHSDFIVPRCAGEIPLWYFCHIEPAASAAVGTHPVHKSVLRSLLLETHPSEEQPPKWNRITARTKDITKHHTKLRSKARRVGSVTSFLASETRTHPLRHSLSHACR
jgi:hypothetical protein